jgi:predicted alpha/beta-fold hydrolase
MDERSDQIEEHINRTRGDLQKNVSELQDKVKGAFDWRAQFQERPLMMLGLALGGGMLAAAVVTRRGRRARYADYGSRPSWRANGRTEEVEPAYRSEGERRAASLSESLGLVKGALMTSVASKVGGLLGQVLANYREQLRNARGREDFDERDDRYSLTRTEASKRPH